jgi:NAD-dependent dihydropyrimidine dehydrogenase PreA subunit
MGSGGAIVMDENTCMVDMARFFMEFIQEESCGKCTPCREGTRRLLQILEKICEGRGEPEDIDTMEELSDVIKESALCGLGQTGRTRCYRRCAISGMNSKPTFMKKCARPSVASNSWNSGSRRICAPNAECVSGLVRWRPSSGRKKELPVIDKDKCIKCLTCYDKCKFGAIM